MSILTPDIFMLAVRTAFRLGKSIQDGREERLRAADYVVKKLGTRGLNLQDAALQTLWDSPRKARYPDVFNLSDTRNLRLLDDRSPGRVAAAIAEGMTLLLPDNDPEARGMSGGEAVAVHTVYSKEAENRQWGRFGKILVETSLEVVAANPQIIGIRGKAETLVSTFAQKVQVIVGEDGPAKPGAPSFLQQAATALLTSSIEGIAANPAIITSDKQLASFMSSVLQPLAKAQADTQGLITLDRLGQLVRGPMARAALKALNEHQDEFVGHDLKTTTALGAVTQELLAAWVGDEKFDITHVFSQRTVATIYTSAFTAVQKRPELFIRDSKDGSNKEVWRKLLKNFADAMVEAPPPFDKDSGLGEKLAGVVIDAAADHLTLRLSKDFANEDAWGQATGDALKSILLGFKEGMTARAKDSGINPFASVFSRDQAVDIVRVFATHAAKSPEMLFGKNATKHENELFAIAKAVSAFMANPNTKLASSEDWRAVIGVALEEAAKNPGALFHIDPTPTVEQNLGYHLVTMMMTHAADALKAPEGGGELPVRRLGSVMFGQTLAEAISLTLKAAANNAKALLDELAAPPKNKDGSGPEKKTHLQSLSDFVGALQAYALKQKGRVGAAEWLWLFRYYVAEVIEKGPALQITEAEFNSALKAIEGSTANPVKPKEESKT